MSDPRPLTPEERDFAEVVARSDNRVRSSDVKRLLEALQATEAQRDAAREQAEGLALALRSVLLSDGVLLEPLAVLRAYNAWKQGP